MAYDAPGHEAAAYGQERKPVTRHGARSRGAVLGADAPTEPTLPGENWIPQESGDPGNLGVGPEWRPNPAADVRKDDLVVSALQSITETLKDLKGSAVADPEVEFSGRPDEDPATFWVQVETWLIRNRVPASRWKTILRRCLKGEAYHWFVEIANQEWGLIKSLFKQKWDSEALRTSLWSQLFGRSQRPDERVAPFIMAKWGLYQRLAPGVDDGQKIMSITELLVPTVRTYCRIAKPASLEALLELTAQVEKDLQDDRGTRRAGPAMAPAPPRADTRQPPQQNRPSQGSGGPPPQRQGREPYPCRWCNSRQHFDNACPQRPLRRAPATQGTAPGAPTQNQQRPTPTAGNGARAPATAQAPR